MRCEYFMCMFYIITAVKYTVKIVSKDNKPVDMLVRQLHIKKRGLLLVLSLYRIN